MWAAGYRAEGIVGGVWDGRIKSKVTVADWWDALGDGSTTTQPDKSGDCLKIYGIDRLNRWDDADCSEELYFFCEKEASRGY